MNLTITDCHRLCQISSAIADCATICGIIISDITAVDEEEVVVSGVDSVHHPLTLYVGGTGGGQGDAISGPCDSSRWTSSGDAGQCMSYSRVGYRIK